MGGFELSALDTLQHGLTGDAERAHGLAHGQEAVVRLGVEARLELVGQANAPGSAGGVLLAGDDAVVEQPVKGRGGDAERDGGLPDGHEIAVGVRRFAEGRDIPVPAQVADAVAVEAMAIGGRAALTVENAGDHGVGIVSGQPAQELDRVLAGADRGGPRPGQVEIDLGQRAAFPTHREMGAKRLRARL